MGRESAGDQHQPTVSDELAGRDFFNTATLPDQMTAAAGWPGQGGSPDESEGDRWPFDLDALDDEDDTGDPDLGGDGLERGEGGRAPRFAFAATPPGSQVGGESLIPPDRLARGGGTRGGARLSIPRGKSAKKSLLDEDWSAYYEQCGTFADIWHRVTTSDGPWPEGYKLLAGKLYDMELLCVPQGLVERVLQEHHAWVGHVGVDRLALEVMRRYSFPIGVEHRAVLQKIRKYCLICQACERPNWATLGPLTMTPIPDRFMASVSFDVFSFPPTGWRGEVYDAFFLCIDRHSGWTIAKPTQKEGLTGEKAAHIMLESTWGEVGVPSVVTSGQDSQFISHWWLNLCSRLGVRIAFAQAHRSRANGRAEVAGRVLQDVLRKLLLTTDITWVEALPRALRIIHDTPDPITGLAPYEIVFGRQRSLAGLPWTTPRECEEADDFFNRMQIVDMQVARALNEAHQALANRLNAKHRERPAVAMGDWVWYRRPTSVGGVKLQSYWQGPFRVLQRLGERSYRLRTTRGHEFDAHLDQLKPCDWEEPDSPGTDLRYPPT